MKANNSILANKMMRDPGARKSIGIALDEPNYGIVLDGRTYKLERVKSAGSTIPVVSFWKRILNHLNKG